MKVMYFFLDETLKGAYFQEDMGGYVDVHVHVYGRVHICMYSIMYIHCTRIHVFQTLTLLSKCNNKSTCIV